MYKTTTKTFGWKHILLGFSVPPPLLGKALSFGIRCCTYSRQMKSDRVSHWLRNECNICCRQSHCLSPLICEKHNKLLHGYDYKISIRSISNHTWLVYIPLFWLSNRRRMDLSQGRGYDPGCILHITTITVGARSTSHKHLGLGYEYLLKNYEDKATPKWESLKLKQIGQSDHSTIQPTVVDVKHLLFHYRYFFYSFKHSVETLLILVISNPYHTAPPSKHIPINMIVRCSCIGRWPWKL